MFMSTITGIFILLIRPIKTIKTFWFGENLTNSHSNLMVWPNLSALRNSSANTLWVTSYRKSSFLKWLTRFCREQPFRAAWKRANSTMTATKTNRSESISYCPTEHLPHAIRYTRTMATNLVPKRHVSCCGITGQIRSIWHSSSHCIWSARILAKSSRSTLPGLDSIRHG